MGRLLARRKRGHRPHDQRHDSDAAVSTRLTQVDGELAAAARRERPSSRRAAEQGDELAPVCAENLDSAILVMKAAENRSRRDGAEPLNRPMDGGVLVQSAMRPRFIVVGGKLANDPAQMGLTEHDHEVETFPSDRAVN